MILKEERRKMERLILNHFEGERLPCVCWFHGMISNVCGLVYSYLIISDFIRWSDGPLRLAYTVHVDKSWCGLKSFLLALAQTLPIFGKQQGKHNLYDCRN